MIIYYDAGCGICNKCRHFAERQAENILEFQDINSSKYSKEVGNTIVVVENDKEYRYGVAIRKIFSTLKYPYKVFSYFTLFLITASYITLREIRKRFSKNICKV